MSAVVINNGKVVSSNVRRILRQRFDNSNVADTPLVDACCPNCQPIIGDASVINPDTTTATCSITCDYSQNDQNIANLANLGTLGSLSGYSTALNLNPYSSLAGLSGLNGLGSFGGLNGLNSLGLNGLNPFLLDSLVNEPNTPTNEPIDSLLS